MCGYLYLYYYLYLMNSYNTTLESKSIEESLPLSKGAGNLCLVELQPQSRLVHTHYKLAYNMRDLIYSSLMIYPTLKIFRLVSASRNPLLVSYLNPLSPKVSNQTNNGLLNYYNSDYNYKYYFFIVLFLSLYLY